MLIDIHFYIHQLRWIPFKYTCHKKYCYKYTIYKLFLIQGKMLFYLNDGKKEREKTQRSLKERKRRN